jgi:hypothetical protein
MKSINLNFVLVPFRASPPMPVPIAAPISLIEGIATRNNAQLNLEFRFPHSSSVLISDPVLDPERRSGLWESTCFECFIGLAGSDQYLECNISPAGHWQAFEFESYRKLPNISKVLTLTGSYRPEPSGLFIMRCKVDINHPRFVTKDWHISPTAVLADQSGDLHYYSNAHPTAKPDFHLAEQRTLVVPFVR